MKKTLFVITAMLFFVLALSSCQIDEVNDNGNTDAGETTAVYVDLGLPSNTKWKSANETGGYNGHYTFEEAKTVFGNKLPSKQQWKELKDKCTWEWQNGGYKVTGKNGNSIFLPAAGCFYSGYNSVNNAGILGYYWTSTPGESDMESACYFHFWSEGMLLLYGTRNNGRSVRLVLR